LTFLTTFFTTFFFTGTTTSLPSVTTTAPLTREMGTAFCTGALITEVTTGESAVGWYVNAGTAGGIRAGTGVGSDVREVGEEEFAVTVGTTPPLGFTTSAVFTAGVEAEAAV